MVVIVSGINLDVLWKLMEKMGGGITRRFPESATAALVSCEDFREEMMKCKDFPGARRL